MLNLTNFIFTTWTLALHTWEKPSRMFDFSTWN